MTKVTPSNRLLNVTVRQVKAEPDINLVRDLARQIWTQHYTPIIGEEQVEYMLGNFQSSEAISSQIDEGMDYYVVIFGDKPAGYLAFKSEGQDLFLSKIYVLSQLRGKGIGRFAMDFVSSKAREAGYLNLTLTVNKNNTDSIRAYLKMGFVNMGPLIKDIGGGFVMDDYLMKKSL